MVAQITPLDLSEKSFKMKIRCGCSSVVEHNLAKVVVEGSNPFARSYGFLGFFSNEKSRFKIVFSIHVISLLTVSNTQNRASCLHPIPFPIIPDSQQIPIQHISKYIPSRYPSSMSPSILGLI